MHLEIEKIGEKPEGAWLLVHGGAWNIPDQEVEAHKQGIHTALESGKIDFIEGNSALQIVTNVVANMESSGIFDAGCGAVLNREGYVQLDAGVMCGDTKRWGAVAGIRHFKNPVQIAQQIAVSGEMQYCFLAREHAEQFARASSFKEIAKESLICERERNRFEQIRSHSSNYHTSHPFGRGLDDAPSGTVGCVVKDSEGRLAAATSTGGTPFSAAGRIGDSPLPGCGYFANKTGAASATGWGEAIASAALCREAVGYLEAGLNTVDSIEKALRNMYTSVRNDRGEGATGGIILLDVRGEAAWGFTTPRMARGSILNGGQRLIKVN